MDKFNLNIDNSLYVVVDMQDKILNAMDKNLLPIVLKSTSTMLQALNIMGVGTISLRQYPKGLGDISMEIKTHLNSDPIDKVTFSACDQPLFIDKINRYSKKNIIISGVETHICVLMTAIDLINLGYNVIVLEDACSSRSYLHHINGIKLLGDSSCIISNHETIIMKLLKSSENEHFRSVSKLLK